MNREGGFQAGPFLEYRIPMTTTQGENIPPCEIRVDKEGAWFYRGAEIIRKDIIALFGRRLETDADGRYVIFWRDQRCYLEVEDTPFVVCGAYSVEENGSIRSFELQLNDGSRVPLDLTTLYIGAENVPYCKVFEGGFPARFSRKAYYQLARYVEEDPEAETFFIRVGVERHVIAVHAGDR